MTAPKCPTCKSSDNVKEVKESTCVDVVRYGDKYRCLLDQYNALLIGYPEGMTPTDVKVLKEANFKMAEELFQIKAKRDKFRVLLEKLSDACIVQCFPSDEEEFALLREVKEALNET